MGHTARHESINATLERVLLFLIEAAGVPVLLSLLVLVFTTTSGAGDEDLDSLPQSAYELYSMATQSAVIQRMLQMGQLKGTAATAEEGAAPRRERMKLKSNQGGAAADFRAGAKLASGDTAKDSDLSEDEVYDVYRRTAKILNLLAQGRFGLSELKQRYVPKDKRLKPIIDKLLDLCSKRQKAGELEDAGLNMLRLTAVDNQQHGRREFSSKHVAKTLAAGGDLELSIWLRLDTEEAGVTLIKTLESLTDSAPAMYQFKHLSFQEGLFARNLLGLVDRKQWDGWTNDASAATFLNNAYMNNVCRIAAGELGKRLAKIRSEWSFDDHRLSWVGKSALWQLVNDNPHLAALSLNGNEVGPGAEGPEHGVDAAGLHRLFSSCPRLASVSLGHNKLGAFSLKQNGRWARALTGNQSLTTLDLQSNNLGADGVKVVAQALLTCVNLRTVNLSHNQPGRNPEELVALARRHKCLTSLSVVEDDEKHLSSKAKTMLGEALAANPARTLAYVACDAFELGPGVTSLKWTSTLAADATLLAGALRSNSTLTALALDPATLGESERTELGKALLENEHGCVSLCDEFELRPETTELEWDLKDSSKMRKGTHMLFGLIRANRKLQKCTLKGLTGEMVSLLAQAMRANTTLKVLQLEHQQQTLKNVRNTTVRLPVQDLTGASGLERVDLSAAGELSKPTAIVLGALLAHNSCLTSLRLSKTQLGDEGGVILEHLGELCKVGPLHELDLSEIGMSDKGGRKLFDSVVSGEYKALTSLAVGGNELRDPKINGILDMLRMEGCPLTSLDVSHNPSLSGTAVMRALKFNTSLTSLNVDGTELDDEGVRSFGTMLLQPDCPCPMSCFSCEHFSVVASTTALSFSGKTLSSSVLTLLFGILKLNEGVTSLNLSGVGIDAEAAHSLQIALESNRALTNLDMRDNPKLWVLNHESGEVESAAGIEAIARGLRANQAVKTVLVDALPLDVGALKGVESTPTLNLSSQKALSPVSAVLVTLLIEQNPSLMRLDLSGNALAHIGHAVGSCLATNSALKEVILRSVEMGDGGVSAIAEGLLANKASSVAYLDLNGNGIGPAGATKVAELLAASTSLTTLDLGRNTMGPGGAATLAGALATNKSLGALSLHDNSIEDEGARALAGALKANGTLSTLWLGKNNIKNEGLAALVDGTLGSKNSKLAVLDLQHNALTAAGLQPMQSLLSEVMSLTAVSLVGIKMDFTDMDALQTAGGAQPERGRSKAVRLWTGKDMNKFPDL